ncbi:TPA: glycosyltransferase [Salmonella enterica subsp. salamae serovar 52:z:z39]|nr:glycosyltransferase [Salmonella enterica subsp. salamae serovar 52:z:z39]
MKCQNAKIAVIMSIYINDRLEDFKEAFNSIINQTYSNFVFFIYADGEINEEIEKYLLSVKSKKVVFLRGTCNKGLAYALNKLITLVIELNDFKYIARMDADDISELDRFQQQVDFFDKNPDVDVVGGLCQEFGGESARKKCKVYLDDYTIKFNLFKKCPFVHPTVMFKASVFNDGVRYPEDRPLTEDICLWFELAYLNKRFANIDSVLLRYRINENTLERRRGLKKAITEFTIRLFYVRRLKMVSWRNIILILTHFFVRVLPSPLFKLIHKIN